MYMNEDESRIIRIYQYLLSNDVYIKDRIYQTERRAICKNASKDDIFAYWLAKVRLECWEEFAEEVWKLLR